MPLRKSLAAGTAAALLLAAPAVAQTTADAATDLNLRAGPGVGFGVVGLIPAGAQVNVVGCLDEASWCEVTYDGVDAYASADYLTALVETEPAPIYPNREVLAVESVTYTPQTSDDEAALGLGAMGAAAGAIIGGPAAIATGVALGLVGGAAANPDEETVTYVTANPVEPVYLTGEVVTGAQLPPEVTLYDTPSPDYKYVNVNGQTVLVTPDERQIVYIDR